MQRGPIVVDRRLSIPCVCWKWTSLSPVGIKFSLCCGILHDHMYFCLKVARLQSLLCAAIDHDFPSDADMQAWRIWKSYTPMQDFTATCKRKEYPFTHELIDSMLNDNDRDCSRMQVLVGQNLRCSFVLRTFALPLQPQSRSCSPPHLHTWIHKNIRSP